ncbi:MAG TPA: cytochrome C oxidase subunit IV family protein [Rhabdochlamydiaceae bacterium]|jgi:cytochrome o ubiquinol oxidase operon protein cyoD
MQLTVTSRIIGLVGSLLLTLAAFFIILHPELFHLKMGMAVIAIFILALLQFLVQSIFFLNLWNEKGPRWNLLVFVSTVSIIIIIIVGTLWIMHHLDCHMMCGKPQE